MATHDKWETSRQKCNCGKGEYIFYSCQYDSVSFLRDPRTWYEMAITCSDCVSLFSEFDSASKGHVVGEKRRISIAESDTVPKLQ